jgi:Ca-activated chloride channel family protein
VAASALALLLYLHSRRPLRRRVSTLKFWNSALGAPVLQRRWLREPWALVAQIALLLLIIAALANPRWGRQEVNRSVVMVLDTSVWSQARPRGESPSIDQIRKEARSVLDSLPAGDRVLLLGAEPGELPTLPATADRVALRRAIANASPSSIVADVPAALELGRGALHGPRRGLLVYVGPGLVDGNELQQIDEFRRRLAQDSNAQNPPQFLVRLAGNPESIQNRGVTGLTLRRDAGSPDKWSVLTEVKNYGSASTSVTLSLSAGGRNLQQHTLALGPDELRKVQDEFVWSGGGFVQAEIAPHDALEADDRAAVEIPSSQPVKVAVFAGDSGFASNLDTLLADDPYVSAKFLAPAAAAEDKPDVAIYAGVDPPVRPTVNSIWFVNGPARGTSNPVPIVNWDPRHPVTRWIRTRDVSVRNPVLLSVQPSDVVLAFAAGNPPKPLILAREQEGRKMLILGFDPNGSNLKLESAFPLLMAGSIEWLTQTVAEVAQSSVTGPIDLRSTATRIVDPSGNDESFQRTGSDVRFVASEPGLYRLIEPAGEREMAVNIPALPHQQWVPIPAEEDPVERESIAGSSRDLWRWFVALAMVPLWLEWWLFYTNSGVRKVFAPEIGKDASPPGDHLHDDLELYSRTHDAETHRHQLRK